MNDQEIEAFLDTLRNELRNTRFSDLAEPEQFRQRPFPDPDLFEDRPDRDLDPDGEARGKAERIDPLRPREEAIFLLEALKTQITLLHQGTVYKTLNRLGDLVPDAGISSVLITSEARGSDADEPTDAEEALNLEALPDLSEAIAALGKLIGEIADPPAESLS